VLPQCQLRLARFHGTDKREFLDQRQLNGHAFQLLEEAILFCQRHLATAARIPRDRLEREEQLAIPLPALREALVNALCHRDYSQQGAAILDKTGRLAKACARLQAAHRRMGESLCIDAFGDPRPNPLGLPSAMLGEIADCQLGKMLDKKRESGSSQRPYLRNANIRWFDVDVSDLLFMDIEDHEMDRFSVCSGDLLVCEGGEPGRAAI
jgi:hypothetical protein